MKPEGHVATEAEGHNIAPQKVTKPNLMCPAGRADFGDAGIGKMEDSAAIGADEHAMAPERLLALAAAIAGHRRSPKVRTSRR